MPNWTINKVTMRQDLFSKLRGRIISEYLNGEVDFNLLLPMPEALRNSESSLDNVYKIYAYLSDRGKDGEGGIEKANLLPAIKRHGKFTLSEMERHIKARNLDLNKLYEEGKLLYLTIQKTGYADWYGWSCDTWGVKWNASDTYLRAPASKNDPVDIVFQTPWNPPFGWLERLADIADFLFIAADEDLGNGVYEGSAHNGAFSFDPIEGARNQEIVHELWGY